MDEIMINIKRVGKKYKLGQIGGTTLREELQRVSAKLRNKEDPTKKIGTVDAATGEEFWAIKNVSFEVKKGERIGIIGHNGAGKSTLLKLLSRITAPTEGFIGLNGRVASMLEVGTGFHPELTGRENIYMNGAILGMTKKEIDSKIEAIIDFSECRQFIDTPVKRYSSGMYVKLAFSVAAHLDSEIMIMDEVLAVGDMKFQEKCIGKMGEVSETEDRTILYVSHNMNTIRKLCTRCIVLDHGTIAFDGNVEEAIALYMSARPLSNGRVALGEMPRSEQFSNPNVWMKEWRVDTNKSIFNFGEKPKISLAVFSEIDVDDVRIEIPVRTMDNISVTRFVSQPVVHLKKGQQMTIEFEVDISRLAPGRYSMNPVLNVINSWGTPKHLDGIVNAFCFEIVASENFIDGSEWSTRYSGYYVAPQLQINACEDENGIGK